MNRTALVSILVVANLVPLVMLGVIIGIVSALVGNSASNCVSVSGVVTADERPAIEGYTPGQVDNAATIVQVGMRLNVSARDQAVAIMAALGESKLENLDQGSKAVPDGRGIFQQPKSWGSETDRMNPDKASEMFFFRLMAINNHATIEPSKLAHMVQANADPTYYGQFWADASRILKALNVASPPQSSTTSGPGSGKFQWMEASKSHGSSRIGVQPHVIAVAEKLATQFEISTLIGFRVADGRGEHSAGLAIDFMTYKDTGKGHRLVEYAIANRDALAIKRVLWQQASYQFGSGRWAPMEDRGSASANHRDHVHIFFNPTPGDAAGGTTVLNPVPPPDTKWCASITDPSSPTNPVAPEFGDIPTVDTGPIRTPLDPGTYRVGSPFGMRHHPILKITRLHAGQDMGAAAGARIRAVKAGTVSFAGWGNGYGWWVALDHGGGTITRYAHMIDRPAVVTGQKVEAGTTLGRVGSTGLSTGPHLHWEVRQNGTPINPADWFRKQAGRPL